MKDEYFGPTVSAAREISELLGLNATGLEQDWEIEFSDPAKIDSMLTALDAVRLGDAAKTALALLLLHSIDFGVDEGGVKWAQIDRARALVNQDVLLLHRLQSYWSRLLRASNPDALGYILFGVRCERSGN